MATDYPVGAPPTGGTNNATPGQFNITYLFSREGIFRICETFLSLLVFILASVNGHFVSEGGGWVQFVSITAFIILIILLVLYIFGFIYNLPHAIPKELIILIYFGVYTLFYFISGIVAAAWAKHDDAVAACTFFSFATMLLFGADSYFLFMDYRESNADMPNPPMTTPPPATVTVPSNTPPPTVTAQY